MVFFVTISEKTNNSSESIISWDRFFLYKHSSFFSFIELGMLIMGLGGGFCEAPMTGFISQVFNGREGFALNMSQIF